MQQRIVETAGHSMDSGTAGQRAGNCAPEIEARLGPLPWQNLGEGEIEPNPHLLQEQGRSPKLLGSLNNLQGAFPQEEDRKRKV